MLAIAVNKEGPSMMIALYNHKNITSLTTRFKATPIAYPYARSLGGKISELYTHMISPILIKKNAT